MLGAFTPVTSVLAYLITISYSSRAPIANYGLDQINGMAALYLAIGPSGRALSIDRVSAAFPCGPRTIGEGSRAGDCSRPSVAARQSGLAADASAFVRDLCFCLSVETAGRELVERHGNLAGGLKS